MSPDTDLLVHLLNPDDDHAWKLAVGHTLRGLLGQTTATNGRVRKLERFMWAAGGGLSVVTAIVVPLFLENILKG